MAEKKRIRVRICGTDYILSSDEPESYVRELGDALDRNMRSIMDNDPRISVTMAAVMAALTLADEARKAGASADNLRSQLKDYLNDNARSRADADQARREADRLRGELQDLRRQYVPGYKSGEGGKADGGN